MATNANTYSRFGLMLKTRRENLRLTMREAVKLTGIQLTTIFRIEHGDDMVAHSSLKKYVIALGGTLEINFPDIPSYKEQKKIDKKKEERNSDFDYTL